MIHIFELTCEELAAELGRLYGKGLYHASVLYRELFRKGNTTFTRAPGLADSPSLALRLTEDICLPACRIISRHGNGVLKFVSALADGHCIESVIIPQRGRTTLCVSSQVGCRRGCTFCATGSMGFVRNLSAEEIVWQVYASRFELGRPADNIVFMGMGEPLDNQENVVRALRVITDQRGLNIACSRITVSTAGHAAGIKNLASAGLPGLRLAVSLNAPDNSLRSTLMPINNMYPLEVLKRSLIDFFANRNGVVFIAYVLLSGINDSHDNARDLARWLKGLSARVNVIACNAEASTLYSAPAPDHVSRFCEWLAAEKVFVRLRPPRGREIMAACGQLGSALPYSRTAPFS